MEDLIGYDKIIEQSMREVMHKVLQKIAKEGIKGNHYFVISFITSYPQVKIPKHIAEQFPDEVTIILQHQFRNLKVSQEAIDVSLNFNGKPENISIPLNAITSFADPSVYLGLKFNAIIDSDDKIANNKSGKKKSNSVTVKNKNFGMNNVISLDDFRKQ